VSRLAERYAARRARIEAGFEAWGHRLARHPWRFIALMLAITLGLGSQLPRVRFDTSNESLLEQHNPVRRAYDGFRGQFGREDLAIIGVETRNVFDFDFLRKLGRFHRALEQGVPHLVDITSLVNARSTHGAKGELIVEDLMEHWPESQSELAELERRARVNPLYRNVFFSPDAHVAALMLKLDAWSSLEASDADADESALSDESISGSSQSGAPDPKFITGEEITEFANAIGDIAKRFDGENFRIHHTGGPIIGSRILTDMQSNMRLFVALALLVIATLLLALFRRIAGIVLPMLVVVFSIIATFGLQGLRGTAIGVPTQIIPSFLLAVGVGASVHLLVIFFQHYDVGESAEQAVASALGHSGLPVAMTALTTVGGLVSFAASPVAPVSDLGVLAPVGVLAGLAYCLVLLPALLVALPLRRKPRPDEQKQSHAITRALVATGDFGFRHAGGVLLVTTLLVVTSLLGALQIHFEHDTLRWFREADPIRKDLSWIDRALAGSMSLEVVLDTGREDGMKDPALLAKLDRLRSEARRLHGGHGLRVTQSLSLADVVKEINRALHDDRPEAYRVPEDRRLVAQELLLFESSGSDDLEDFVDGTFRIGRFTLRLPYVPPTHYHNFIPDVEQRVRTELGDGVQVWTTGFMALLAASLDAVARTMFRSYAIALLIITPLMMALIGTLRGGLVSMIPNLAPIVLVLGLMGWTGIDFDLFTLMIGSIAIGLAVDDTIHFMHNFYRDYRRSNDTRGAIRRTLESTGQAMLVTSIVLCCGFFTYMLSDMTNLFNFGMLTGLAIVLAFIADVLVGPALVTIATHRRVREGHTSA